jgi:hypothetical protein
MLQVSGYSPFDLDAILDFELFDHLADRDALSWFLLEPVLVFNKSLLLFENLLVELFLAVLLVLPSDLV